MTADPSVTDWAAAFADANAHVRALTGRPAVPREADLATYRDAEGKSRAREEDDDWAETRAEDITHERAARVARYHERNEP